MTDLPLTAKEDYEFKRAEPWHFVSCGEAGFSMRLPDVPLPRAKLVTRLGDPAKTVTAFFTLELVYAGATPAGWRISVPASLPVSLRPTYVLCRRKNANAVPSTKLPHDRFGNISLNNAFFRSLPNPAIVFLQKGLACYEIEGLASLLTSTEGVKL